MRYAKASLPVEETFVAETVVPIRKRKIKPLSLGSSFGVLLLMGAVSAFVWIAEVTATGRKKEKLRQLRLHMRTVRQDSKTMLQKVEASKGRDSLDVVDEFMEKHGDDEMRREHRESMVGIHAIQRESDDLQRIVQGAGDDKARAAQEIQKYIEEHGESALAYGYLGGVFRQAELFDESLIAYQKAAQLSEAQGRTDTNHLQIGSVLQEKGDIDAAIAKFRHLIQTSVQEEDGTLGLAYLYLGNALEAKGDLVNARVAWKEAIRWDQFKVIRKTAQEKIQASL